MRISVCLGAILIPEYLDFYSGYSTTTSRIAGIYSGIYSGINSYSGISQTNAPLNCTYYLHHTYTALLSVGNRPQVSRGS